MSFFRPSKDGLKKAFTLGKISGVKDLSSSVADRIREETDGLTIEDVGKYSWRYCFNRDYGKYLEEFGLKEENSEIAKENALQRSKGYFITSFIFLFLGVFGNMLNDFGFLTIAIAIASVFMAIIFFWQGTIMRWHYLVNKNKKMLPLTEVFGKKNAAWMMIFCPTKAFKKITSSVKNKT